MTARELRQTNLAVASEVSHGQPLESLQRWGGDGGGWQAVPHGNSVKYEYLYVSILGLMCRYNRPTDGRGALVEVFESQLWGISCEPSDCVLCTTWRSLRCFGGILVNPILDWILGLWRLWFDCSPYRQSVLPYSVQTPVSVSCPVFVGSMLCWYIQVWVWLESGVLWLCKTWELHVMCVGWLIESAWHCFSPFRNVATRGPSH